MRCAPPPPPRKHVSPPRPSSASPPQRHLLRGKTRVLLLQALVTDLVIGRGPPEGLKDDLSVLGPHLLDTSALKGAVPRQRPRTPKRAPPPSPARPLAGPSADKNPVLDKGSPVPGRWGPAGRQTPGRGFKNVNEQLCSLRSLL